MFQPGGQDSEAGPGGGQSVSGAAVPSRASSQGQHAVVDGKESTGAHFSILVRHFLTFT